MPGKTLQMCGRTHKHLPTIYPAEDFFPPKVTTVIFDNVLLSALTKTHPVNSVALTWLWQPLVHCRGPLECAVYQGSSSQRSWSGSATWWCSCWVTTKKISRGSKVTQETLVTVQLLTNILNPRPVLKFYFYFICRRKRLKRITQATCRLFYTSFPHSSVKSTHFYTNLCDLWSVCKNSFFLFCYFEHYWLFWFMWLLFHSYISFMLSSSSGDHTVLLFIKYSQKWSHTFCPVSVSITLHAHVKELGDNEDISQVYNGISICKKKILGSQTQTQAVNNMQVYCQCWNKVHYSSQGMRK